MRKRIERGEADSLTEPRRYVPHPRLKPDFTIRIESKSGDRVQFSVTRFGKSFITPDGSKSAREISRGVENLIRLATP